MRFNKQQQGCRRTDPRSAMNCEALAFRRDGRRSVVSVSDISFSGLQIEGGAFAYDEEIRLVIPYRGEIDARVRWASLSTAGAWFDEDVLPGDVLPARERYALRLLGAFNFGSGRVFGRRSIPA